MAKPGKKPDKKMGNFYAKYSSMAFQMIIIMILGVYGGIKADEYFDTSPWLTLVGVILGFSLALYFAIKDVINK